MHKKHFLAHKRSHEVKGRRLLFLSFNLFEKYRRMWNIWQLFSSIEILVASSKNGQIFSARWHYLTSHFFYVTNWLFQLLKSFAQLL